MQCSYHMSVPAVDRCSGCAEPFCQNCLVEIHGRRYCAACKVMTVKRRERPPAALRQGKLCPEAREALIFAIVGLFLCAIIFEPIALMKANQAFTNIAANPTLTGNEMARAAQIIAILGLILWGLGIAARAMSVAAA